MPTSMVHRVRAVQSSGSCSFGAEVLSLLRCPADGGDLQMTPNSATEFADANALHCATCDATWPVRNGVPRFVKDDQYAGNFSHEWAVHRKTQLDDEGSRISEATFAFKAGFTPQNVEGKLVLDIGCGMGRFADVVVKWGGRVVGIDLSLAVESAQANLGRSGRFQAIQANLFDLPLRPEVFDLIYSIGVLHHTPDCKKAFMQLPPLLKPDGLLAVWLYSKHVYAPGSIDEIRDTFYRRFMTRMNPRLLHAIFRVLCAVRMPFKPFWHMLLPGFIFHAIPRLQSYPRYDWRVLDAFDWYSPVYQSKHSYPEVCGWFREAGFREIRPLEAEVSVWGRK